jgi:hypothetical protein|tara:strand:- start:3634 stop:3855 length:222 start_codon:yes stop_codon:yes gene_type:complete
MIDIETDISALKTHSAFVRFLQFVEILRDEQIAELHEAEPHKVQQISGRILSYDQLLEMCDYKDSIRNINTQV